MTCLCEEEKHFCSSNMDGSHGHPRLQALSLKIYDFDRKKQLHLNWKGNPVKWLFQNMNLRKILLHLGLQHYHKGWAEGKIIGSGWSQTLLLFVCVKMSFIIPPEQITYCQNRPRLIHNIKWSGPLSSQYCSCYLCTLFLWSINKMDLWVSLYNRQYICMGVSQIHTHTVFWKTVLTTFFNRM